MSGLSGHMMHPHEDITLTVEKYWSLVYDVMSGHNNYKISEKLDGFGLQVCFVGKQARLVRSKTDLENKGVAIEDIPERMAYNEAARDLYTQALQNLQRVADSVNTHIPQWPSTINCEVLTEGITNVIEYHRGFKVYIHNIWERDQDMNVTVESSCPFLDEIKNLNDDVISLTPEIKLVKQPEVITNLVMDKLDELLHGCDNLRDVYIARTSRLIPDKSISRELAADIVDYIFKNNPKNLRTLKKKYGEKWFEEEALVRFKNNAMGLFDEFDLMVGEIVISSITPQSENVLQCDLMNEMEKAARMGLIDYAKFQRQMCRWEIIGYRLHSIEGIVVNGKYKFTGPFGPVNQIIGCIKRNAER